MFELFFSILNILDDILWTYVAIPAIVIIGFYFTYKSNFMQILSFKKIFLIFAQLFHKKRDPLARGIHPLETFFTAIGGCIGVGNVVGVCAAVKIGGPGAIFWMWIVAISGMIMKYSEIYFGITYRVKNDEDSYDGGPMYFLKHTSSNKTFASILSKISAILLCIYGAEIYIFRVVTDSIVSSWNWDYNIVVFSLLLMVFLSNTRGMKMVGDISSVIMPVFLLSFWSVCLFILIKNATILPSIFMLIIKSAFSGHAASGAFVGSSMALAISSGMKRACYAGDIGIGYSSVIHSETSEIKPEREAILGIIGIFFDIFMVCTMSTLIVLITGVWNTGVHEDVMLAKALAIYIPHVEIIWPIFIFLLGYSTIIAFFAVGKKAAKFLFPNYGQKIYTIYAIFALLLFSYIGTKDYNLLFMSFTGALLLSINAYGMFKLRNKISFDI